MTVNIDIWEVIIQICAVLSYILACVFFIKMRRMQKELKVLKAYLSESDDKNLSIVQISRQNENGKPIIRR
jgi:hypothetical protein